MTAAAVVVSVEPRAARGPRILFVDDEPAVLEGIAANLRRGYDIVTAPSGAAGLELLRKDPSIAVVVSDMRMPHMTGAAFLAEARHVAPHAVRMLLTGQTDLESAVQVVNHGQIFRFLTKPCGRTDLLAAVETAVQQHRLQTAERELLEQTLSGAVKMLVDVLALTCPLAFGRANRIKTRVLELAGLMKIKETWQLEVAALASQLGYITLPQELMQKLGSRHQLSDDERRLVAAAPATAGQLLAHIPRLELVRDILATHVRPPARSETAMTDRKLVELGAHLLRFALDLDDLLMANPATAVDIICSRKDYDPEVMTAFLCSREEQPKQIKELPLAALKVGMTLAEEVRTPAGALLVASGYEITRSFLERVNSFPRGSVVGPFKVYVD
jgi:CheY-like chemotaxis protein